jgi:hypothetical protein
VIAGASGMIGHALAERLHECGDEVVRLVRRPARAKTEVHWRPDVGMLDPAVLDGADALVGLAGAPIGRLPWTPRRKRAILESRLDVTRTLVDAVRAAERPPAVFVSGSAVGYYGDRGDEDLTERSPRGTGFLSAVVSAWEDEAERASDVARVAFVRTGLVIGATGTMRPLRVLTLAGLAGPLGSGRQWWPWISLRDEAAAIDHVIGVVPSAGGLRGPVNLAGPTPATQSEIMRHLARRLRRPYGLPTPALALRSALQGAADELLLCSQRVLPEVLLNDGFRFRDGTVDSAIVDSLSAA